MKIGQKKTASLLPGASQSKMPTGLCSVKNKVTSGVSKGMPKPYGAWQVWEDAPTFTAISLAETIDGGQAFRWQRKENFYEGRWDKNAVRLRFENEQIEFTVGLEFPLFNA